MPDPLKTRVLLIAANEALAAALAQRPDLEVRTLNRAARRRADNSAAFKEVDSGVDYVYGSKLSFYGVQSVREAIRRVKPDVVHAFLPRSLAHTVLAVKASFMRPQIVSYRGITSRALRWDPVQWITYHSSLVAAHACESEAVRQALVTSGVAADRCELVYNCLDRPIVPQPRDAVRDAWGVPRDSFVVATVANMRPVKGMDLLLRAAAECADLGDVYWVLMGEARDARLKSLASDPRIADRVRMTGFRSDASEMVAASDVFVMPSRAEALCRALLEAMSLGVCPLVSDAGGMKEAVRHGVDGLVVPREDIASLASAMRTLCANRAKAREFGESARRRIAEDFSVDAMADRCAGVYRRAMGVKKEAARAA